MTRLRLASVGVFVCLGCVFHQAAQPGPGRDPLRDPGRPGRLLAAERIRVEIDWLPGAAPAPRSVEGAREFLARYARPPAGVEVRLDEEIAVLPDGRASFALEQLTDAELWSIQRSHRQQRMAPGTESIYLLFVPRRFDAQQRRHTRGIAIQEHAFAVIGRETIHEMAFLAIRGDEIERFVVQHELGHLLGLVAGAHHQVHGHCTNPVCLMYARPDLRAGLAHWWRAFTGRLPAGLDRDCEADLEALRVLPGRR